jgi:putative flippase GtrA
LILTLRELALRYALFAVIATTSNFASQEASLRLYSGGAGLTISILCGTIIGFGVKYILDKRYIFFDLRASAMREMAKVLLYAFTAVATTLIFWSFELGFWAIWSNSFAKYTGASIGLGIGYVVKYTLDRRFVFAESGTS